MTKTEEPLQETTFILLHQIVTGIEAFLYAACLAAFLRPFMSGGTEALGSIRKKSLFVFFDYSSVFLMGMLLPGHGTLYMMLVTALLIAASRYLGIERKLLFLLSVLFYCIRHLSLMVTQSADYFSNRLFLLDADTPEKVFLGASYNYLLTDGLMFLCFAIMLHGLARQFRKQALTLHVRELCYLLLTPVTGILFVNITLRFLLIADGTSIFQLYKQVPAAVCIVPLLSFLFYAGTLAAIALCQKTVLLQEERGKHFAEQQQLAAIQERLVQMEQIHDGIRRMKHEMRGHMANIKGLAEKGCYEDMERYIARMDENMQVFEFTVSTGNAVTDVIVNDRQRAAARLGIDFSADFICPPPEGYDVYDIGIILNNLLQNALEACQKTEAGQRYISLSGRKKNRFYLIEVRNSFDGNVTFHPRTGLPVSSKEARPETGSAMSAVLHGIGLSNVKREAEKYRGNVDIKTEGHEFQVTVLLQENPAV
nr:sensor histidine kinase [uncultured Acetatifactor sp.]